LDKKSAAAVLDRLQIALGAKNDSQLCELTEVQRPTLGNWRSRNSVPYSLCVDISERKGLSLDWLLKGEGPMHPAGADSLTEMPAANPQEVAILELFRALDEPARREIQSAVEEKKRLKEIELRLEELTEALAATKRPA
jgi:hypothetical protein